MWGKEERGDVAVIAEQKHRVQTDNKRASNHMKHSHCPHVKTDEGEVSLSWNEAEFSRSERHLPPSPISLHLQLYPHSEDGQVLALSSWGWFSHCAFSDSSLAYMEPSVTQPTLHPRPAALPTDSCRAASFKVWLWPSTRSACNEDHGI